MLEGAKDVSTDENRQRDLGGVQVEDRRLTGRERRRHGERDDGRSAGGREPTAGARRATVRRGWRPALLILPAGLWYLFLLVLPIAIVVVFSFGNRGETGGYAGGFTFDNYDGRVAATPIPFLTSLYLSIAGTILCLLVGPAARLLHRDPRRQAQDAC